MSFKNFIEIIIDLGRLLLAECLLAYNIKLFEKQIAKTAKGKFIKVYARTKSKLLRVKAAYGVSRCAFKQLKVEDQELKEDNERLIKLQKHSVTFLKFASECKNDLLRSKKEPGRTITKWFLDRYFNEWIKAI